MTIARSTGLVNFVASKGSVRQAMQNCRVLIFGNSIQTPDGGSGGVSPLVTLTPNGGAFSAEVLPKWRFVLSGSSGSVDSIKIGGVEQLVSPIAYATSLQNTAQLVVDAINNNGAHPDYTAAVSGANSDEVSIYGPVSCGASLNSLILAVTTTTLTATLASAGAVETTGVAAVNAGQWTYTPSNGVLSKDASPWSGTIQTSGTAIWFMLVTDNDNGMSASTTARRIVGKVELSGGDLDLSAISLVQSATVTINAWNLTVTK